MSTSRSAHDALRALAEDVVSGQVREHLSYRYATPLLAGGPAVQRAAWTRVLAETEELARLHHWDDADTRTGRADIAAQDDQLAACIDAAISGVTRGMAA